MSNTEITPELLRSVATWLRDNAVGALPGKPLAAEFLDGAADDMEREQADEKRIDELAGVFWDASVKGSGFEPAWDSVAEDAKPYYRAGVRAVLAHLEDEREHEELITDPLEAADYQERVLGIPARPRTWNDLRDVPDDVVHVKDVEGNCIVRPAHGWRAYISNPDFAPWTEVIADA